MFLNAKKRNEEKKSEYESRFVLMDMPSDIRKATLTITMVTDVKRR
jgi:hypothetical protein